MRVLTGELKGRTILFKAGSHIRPTADRTRKAVFDSISALVAQARVLDLFSGTGALGIEALSGGAASAIFVERDKVQAESIRKNLEILGLKDRGQVLVDDALSAVAELSAEGQSFDLVFFDPPYDEKLGSTLLEELDSSGVLERGAAVVAEGGVKEAFPERCGGLRLRSKKFYGDTQIAIYLNQGANRHKGE